MSDDMFRRVSIIRGNIIPKIRALLSRKRYKCDMSSVTCSNTLLKNSQDLNNFNVFIIPFSFIMHMGEYRERIGSWWGNRRERDHWGDLGVDGWIILRWISRRWDVGMWTGLGWPRTGTGGGRL